MKAAIAYTLVIFGATQMAAIWIVSRLIVPIARLLPYTVKIRFLPALIDFLNGAAALALAITLFLLLSVSISVLLPFIVAGWLTFYFLTYGQSKMSWVAAITGVIACWIVYRITLAA